MKSAFGLLALLAALVAADRLTKLTMMARPPDSGRFPSGGIVEFTHHQNFGIIANIPLPLIAIIAISGGVLVLIAIGFMRAIRRKEIGEAAALTLILAGAVGNLWDRLQWQFVFDWLLLFGRSAINLADVMIGIGLLWYLADRNRDLKHEGPHAAIDADES